MRYCRLKRKDRLLTLPTIPTLPTISTLPHTIERTRNRTSRAILRDEAIVIRLARGLSNRQEQEHIDVLLRRISKAFLRRRHTLPVDPFRDVLSGVRQPVRLTNGTEYHFAFVPGRTLRANQLDPQTWEITVPSTARKPAVHRLLWKVVATTQYKALLKRVLSINAETLRTHIPAFTLRYASSKWGSCSRKSGLMLNAALLFVPESVLDYVIVHELCHFPHPNHSQAFWNEVERWMPDYRERLKVIKGFRLLKIK